MYRRILLISGDTIDGDGALEAALALASAFGAALTMLLILKTPAFPISIGEVDDARRAAEVRSSYIISSVATRAENASVAFHANVARGAMVNRTLEYLHDHPADLIVMADLSSRFGFLPSRAVRLAQRTTCSVHIVRV